MWDADRKRFNSPRGTNFIGLNMSLTEILERCHDLGIAEKRNISDEYCEIVIYNKDIEQWDKIFGEIFGQPQKKAGGRPTQKDMSLTKSYGGIRDNQILYRKDFEEGTLLVMFWPWRDGSLITLKMIFLNK